LKAGDEILITGLEHHANIVPWQFLRDQIGVKLKVCPVNGDGSFDPKALIAMITPATKLVAVAHISNVLGYVLPIADIARAAHAMGAKILVDGCQAVSHATVDVTALDVDFYVFSAHKLYGPTGVGVLYGKYDLLESMPPYQGGGDMIETVSFEKTTFKKPPHRFEAGTPAIAEVVGLGAAIEYVSTIGLPRIAQYETALRDYAVQKLSTVNSVKLMGQESPLPKAGVISFVMTTAHPHDIGTVLDSEGIAVRAGHHCAEPLMAALGVPGTARISLALYNTMDDIDRLVAAVHKVEGIFA
jgi:cysteine desulfurase / selenocysteine lyase